MAIIRKGIKSSAQDNFIAPDAPTGVSATDVGTNREFNNGAATVTFSAPTTGNTVGITSYTATSSPGGYTASGASSPLTVTGLQSNTAYTFTVTATNAYGTSAASSASASITATTVPATPAAPTVSSVANQSTDVVSWTAPATGGKALSTYYWTSSDGKSGNVAAPTTSVNVAQEAGTAQTYNVYVSNANGNSATSANSASFTSFAFTPFGFTPFAFTPFAFTPFAFTPFAFTPFGFVPTFSFTPAFSFAPLSFAFTPSFSFYPEFSVGSSTGIRTPNGIIDAQYIEIGDTLYAMEIDDLVNDWTSWTINSEDLMLNETNLRETTVVSISSRIVDELYQINGDLFSDSHYILTKKDGICKFRRISEIDTSYMIYNYNDHGFTNIISLEVVPQQEMVYSINCEPYDNFFTENVLVFDTPDPAV